jgi:cysteine synthase A
MKGAIAKAEQLRDETPNAIILGQFTNPANPAIHYTTTGQEIWEDTAGQVDVFIAGVGTGGTLTGAGRYLKERNPDIQVIAVEPKDSPVLSGGRPGAHKLQGIGAGFLPLTLDTAIYDEVIAVSTEEAYDAARVLAKEDGILAGISAGAALRAAEQVARRSRNRGKSIVVIIPDSGEKYLSGPLFE